MEAVEGLADLLPVRQVVGESGTAAEHEVLDGQELLQAELHVEGHSETYAFLLRLVKSHAFTK